MLNGAALHFHQQKADRGQSHGSQDVAAFHVPGTSVLDRESGSLPYERQVTGWDISWDDVPNHTGSPRRMKTAGSKG